MKSYPGGKTGNGTFQTIINHIPKHDFYFEGFGGSVAVYRKILPATLAIICELSSSQLSSIKSLLLPGHIALRLDVVREINVIVEVLNYLQASGISVFAYFDPPYLFETRASQKNIYEFELSEADHIAFLQGIGSAKFNCMVSCYRHPIYNSMLESWNSHDFQSMTRHGLRTETIFFNYPTPCVLQDYRYIGNDFREREKLQRIHKNLLSKINSMPAVLRNSIFESLFISKS